MLAQHLPRSALLRGGGKADGKGRRRAGVCFTPKNACHSRASGNPAPARVERALHRSRILLNTGGSWVPAFAGMTRRGESAGRKKAVPHGGGNTEARGRKSSGQTATEV